MTANTVLYICSGRSFHSADPGRKIAEVAACWRRLGYAVDLLCGGDILPRSVDKAGYGAPETYAPWYRRSPLVQPLKHSLSEWRDILHNRALTRRACEIARRSGSEVVWERSARLHESGLPVARALKVPYVLEWKDHLVPYRHSLFRSRALAVEARKVDSADFVTVESTVLADWLVSEGVPRGKVIVAHNAVDAAFFQDRSSDVEAKRRAMGIPSHKVIVGYLGSYTGYHDVPRLIAAAALLSPALKGRVFFLLVGDGEHYKTTRKLAAEQGFLDRLVHMHPPVPAADVPSVLSAVDIAVLPGSTDIICPIKVQEYMAAGRAVVVPDYACNREVIDHATTGMLFTPRDERALADVLATLVERPDLTRLLGDNARRRAAQRFTWDATWGMALQSVFRQKIGAAASLRK